jgi:Protein of unknown function (DUF1670)
MKVSLSNPETRWAKRSIHQQLLAKFLNEYGYERGPKVADAIVKDILAFIDGFYSDALAPRHINWPAVPIENGSGGKSPDVHSLVKVILQMVTDQEIALLNDHKLCGERKAKRSFNQTRFVRWCNDAFAQGGVLTLFDLSLLGGLSEKQVSHLLLQYEQEHNTIVPIRGTVHDIGPSVSHKSEVIRRYLRGQNPMDIAHELNHSQTAVDIYIKDYMTTRTLIQKFPIQEVPILSNRSLSVVNEHVKLIRLYEPHLCFFSA